MERRQLDRAHQPGGPGELAGRRPAGPGRRRSHWLAFASETITSATSISVRSLSIAASLQITGGTLTVGGTLEVDNTFTLSGGTLAGATVQPGSGGQGVLITSWAAVLNGVTLDGDLTVAYKRRRSDVDQRLDAERRAGHQRRRRDAQRERRLDGEWHAGRGQHDQYGFKHETVAFQNTQTIDGSSSTYLGLRCRRIPNGGGLGLDLRPALQETRRGGLGTLPAEPAPGGGQAAPENERPPGREDRPGLRVQF